MPPLCLREAIVCQDTLETQTSWKVVTLKAAAFAHAGPDGAGSRIMWRVTVADDDGSAGTEGTAARL
jgi:hypothetical protein